MEKFRTRQLPRTNLSYKFRRSFRADRMSLITVTERIPRTISVHVAYTPMINADSSLEAAIAGLFSFYGPWKPLLAIQPEAIAEAISTSY